MRTTATCEEMEMEEQKQIRVMSVDDHPLLREGIVAVVNSQKDMQIVAQAASGSEAVEQYRKHRPEVVLMDLRLPDISGIDAMSSICKEFPEARVIVVTTVD